MQKLKFILLAAIITVVSASASITTAYAAPDPPPPPVAMDTMPVSPRYIYAYTAEADLSISGKTATAYVSLDGNSNTKRISVTYSLQKKTGISWSTVKTWSARKTAKSLISEKSYSSLTSGAQYRVYATFTVTGIDGGTETITDYSGTYTC